MAIDCLLISPPSSPEGQNFYIPCYEIPLNIISLAAYVEREGFTCAVVDYDVEQVRSLKPFLDYYQPRVIGFTASTPYLNNAARLAREARELAPGTPRLIGGYHASALPVRTLEEYAEFDVLAFGESDLTLTELLRYYLRGEGSLEEIKGIVRRSGDGEILKNPRQPELMDLDELPFPDRHKLKNERYLPNPVNFASLPTTAIMASRGCHEACTFCAVKTIFKRVRARSGESVVSEMQHCLETWGMRDFRFYDDDVTYFREQFMDMCRLIGERDLKVTWNCFSRVDCVDEELLVAAKKAGCYQLKYGVETGTDRMMAVVKKHIDLKQVEAAINLARKVGIETQISIILGLPGERPDEITQSISVPVRLSPDLVLFNVFKPLPGSFLFKQLEQESRITSYNWDDYLVRNPSALFKGDYTDEQLAGFMKQAYKNFYLRPRYVLQRLRWLLKYPHREFRRVTLGVKILMGNILFSH